MSTHEHHHIDQHGFIHKCYHSCKSILTDWKFWIGVTFSFPLEHFLWTKVPVFSHVAEFLGLIGH